MIFKMRSNHHYRCCQIYLTPLEDFSNFSDTIFLKVFSGASPNPPKSFQTPLLRGSQIDLTITVKVIQGV